MVKTPVPGPREVLVEVAATSFNPSEAGLRRGLLRGIVEVDLPYIMGLDLAGTVTKLGPDVRGLTEGDRVIGRVDGGAAAEYAVAPAEALVPVPENVPLTDAAVLPIAGLTAWQAVFEHAHLSPGHRVLINGAGAIGRLAIQLARHAGAHVVALATSRNVAAAQTAGAHETLTALGAAVEPFDAVIHLAPAAPPPAMLLLPGGILVSATTPADQLPAGGVHFIVRHDTADLAAMLNLVSQGTLQLDVAARRPLTDLPDVHREAEAGLLLPGKTLLLPKRR
ncbi:NADP-dependent oxidoreductase [Actinoplanes sp. GCM10030250]|uniref:NADP-dependent oxidoreductase n=1 Tax=Actinoplanes sp. GCM10030250 TaxID=3273376 RepID=UPI00361C0020